MAIAEKDSKKKKEPPKIPRDFEELCEPISAVFNGGVPGLTGREATIVAVKNHGQVAIREPKDLMVIYRLKGAKANKLQYTWLACFKNPKELLKQLA